MSISPYFHHQTFKTEQDLLKDLTRETIYLRGNDYMYIPREKVHLDTLFGEDVKSSFKTPVIIEMYCMQNAGWEGSNIMSKFGFMDQHEMTFQVAKTRFEEEMSKVFPDIKEPMEGDLIFHDLTGMLFEITYVEGKKPFYTNGIPTVYELQCKRYIHNYDEVDIAIDKDNIPESAEQFLPTDEDVNFINEVEHENDSKVIQNESDDFLNFDENDPFTEAPGRGSHY